MTLECKKELARSCVEKKRKNGVKPFRSVGQFDIYGDDILHGYWTWDNSFSEWLPGYEPTVQAAVNSAAFLSD